MRERLADADHPPFQRAERDPEPQRVLVDRLPAPGPVGTQQIVDVAESADELAGDAETPRLHAQPAEILDGIAEMGELPIEHRAYAFRPDDEVAVAEVAVDELGMCRGGRQPCGQRAQSQLERGVGLTECVEQRAVLIDLIGRGPDP